MSAFTRPLFFALTLATLAAPALAEEKAFNLDPFTAIDIATGIHAEVTEAAEHSIVATGDPRALEDLKLEVRDGVLHAHIDWNFMQFLVEGGLLGEFMSEDDGIALKLGMPQLDAATASSGALITVGSIANTGRFAAEASSGAHVVLNGLETGRIELDTSSGASIRASGQCETIEADASSGSQIEATAMACTDASAEASSGASIGLSATGTIEADASSGAHINVSGHPAEVQTDESFGGSVTVN